jgi:hypothetical protein
MDDQVAALQKHRQTVGDVDALLDDGHFVAALQQNRRQVLPDFSASGNHDVHAKTLSP